MNKDSIIKEINKVSYWRHTIKLPFGLATPGRIGSDLIRRLNLPKDMSGKTLLDIGTFDGLCAFEAESRNASRVLAIDTWHGEGTDDPEWWLQLHTGGLGFRIAKKILNSKVESKELSVYVLDPKRLGKFDYVLMCGLLYHLRDPITAIERALSVTKGVLVIESALISIKNIDLPIVVFTKKLNREVHPSNWWEFSQSAVEDICYTAGASRVVVENIFWYPSTRRYIRVKGTIDLFEYPRIDAQIVNNIDSDGELELEVDSRRYTFRDGYYWLRVIIRKANFDNKLYGWFRLPPGNDLPKWREEKVKLKGREGRIVLKVFL